MPTTASPAKEVVRRTGGGFALPTREPQAPATVRAVFEANGRPDKTPYWLDRDESMYTPDAIEKREELRLNPGLIDAVRRFRHSVYRTDESGAITKQEYFRVHTAIVRILMGDKVSERQVQQIVADDWSNDTAGEENLDPARTFDSLFELADTWCPNISAAEYLAFIDTLAYKLMKGEGEPPSAAPTVGSN
mmetsp:Transcript_22202/g.57043  ORF Transcript_22202/g.57043 Transcript_22202/m.57043 type:complete len:191 (+) Transcript_22202:29-601(+)